MTGGPIGGRSAARAAVAAALLAAVLAPPAMAAPPALTARAAILVEASSGDVVLARQPDRALPIASTTKLMTALLARERVALADTLTAAAYGGASAESRIGLRAGERMTVADLLRALMLPSANDAAATLARGIAGSRAAFVAEMNRRARELGLRHTSYANPIGLDEAGNHSSARDLARLALLLRRDRFLAAVMDRPRARLRSGARPRTVVNRNALVRRVPEVDGVKTGHTLDAGYVLVGSATRAGVSVVSVVLGEPSEAARDRDSLALLRYGLGRYRLARALRRGQVLARPEIRLSGGRHVALVPARPVTVTVRRGEAPSVRVDAPDAVEGPLRAGEQVGRAEVRYRGRRVATVALLTARTVRGAGFGRRLVDRVTSPLALLVLVAVGVPVALRRRARRRRRRRRRVETEIA